MITYKEILNSIRSMDYGIITIILDFIGINFDFIYLIEEDLKTEYDIQDLTGCWHSTYNNSDIQNEIDISKDKSIIIFYYKNDFDLQKINFKKNTILIILQPETKNALVPIQTSYLSDLILGLKDRKLKILKSRLLPVNIEKSIDIDKLLRKTKLNKLDKLNK